MNIPVIANTANLIKKYQSGFIFCTSPEKPINELHDIINREVPMAFFIGNFAKWTKAGIIKKPPPAPIKPINIPTQKIWKIMMKIFGFLSPTSTVDALEDLSIAKAAKNITIENNTVRNKSLVMLK